MDLKSIYSEDISKAINNDLDVKEIYRFLEKPKYEEQGDLAFPCFSLSKTLRKSPQLIAKELEGKIHKSNVFERIVAEGPYLNCFFNKEYVSTTTIQKVISEGKQYGHVNIGNGQNITVDFSSPNIAKPFSMGHLRSTVIGNSLALLSQKCGYKTVRINHLGDWGTQFGKLIVAYKKWGDEKKVKNNPIKELLSLYVRFHEEAEINPSLNEEGRMWFKILESGDNEAQHLWKWFRDESLKEFSKVYDLLDVQFDSYNGEAFYNDKMDETIKNLIESGLLTTSDGAEVVDLESEDLPPCLIKKSDGATLYATRDLTAAIYRYKNYNPVKGFYIVGAEQALHFKQIFLVLSKLGYEWANNLEHIPFGFILKDGKKMSTRKGKIVLLEEVISEAIELAKENITLKNPNLENKDEVARIIGVGSIIFHDLKNERQNNVEFSLEDMLKFEGNTGPYIQYTHARACSILRKSEIDINKLQVEQFSDKDAWGIIKLLKDFPEAIERSFLQREPSQMARYLFDLSQEFNKYYAHVKILVADNQLENRVSLVKAVTIVLEEGLRLLGIKAPKKM